VYRTVQSSGRGSGGDFCGLNEVKIKLYYSISKISLVLTQKKKKKARRVRVLFNNTTDISCYSTVTGPPVFRDTRQFMVEEHADFIGWRLYFPDRLCASYQSYIELNTVKGYVLYSTVLYI